ncbi:urease accessory protein UreD [Streptomyces sp. Isolate_219]|uniref:urease accessory protein UreD n=1 Tax=Streptomyces sp. Isolate_219 TaxID=2950110 RepID=UPI0029058C6E|nr:urease accessory protein UreD [Streptomyces sp. Isolate_219]
MRATCRAPVSEVLQAGREAVRRSGARREGTPPLSQRRPHRHVVGALGDPAHVGKPAQRAGRRQRTHRASAARHITSAAATLALPGPTPEHTTYDVHLTVAEDAELHWLPKPLICAAGSNLRQTWTVDLSPTAQLVLRDEQVLGRAGEPPGHVATRLTVRRGGHLLLDQETEYGPDTPGWDGPAVLADHRATGQILIVGPAFESKLPGVQLFVDEPEDGQAILTPLAGSAALVTTVAPDGFRLRRLLDTARRRRPRSALTGPPPTVGAQHGLARIDFTGWCRQSPGCPPWPWACRMRS